MSLSSRRQTDVKWTLDKGWDTRLAVSAVPCQSFAHESPPWLKFLCVPHGLEVLCLQSLVLWLRGEALSPSCPLFRFPQQCSDASRPSNESSLCITVCFCSIPSPIACLCEPAGVPHSSFASSGLPAPQLLPFIKQQWLFCGCVCLKPPLST